jgi:hypothetical protein
MLITLDIPISLDMPESFAMPVPPFPSLKIGFHLFPWHTGPDKTLFLQISATAIRIGATKLRSHELET